MMYMTITCNPYAENPFPKILMDKGDGTKKQLAPNSSLMRVEKQPLKDSLSPSRNWKGFFQTVYSSLGLDKLTLEFTGTAEDFQLLKAAYDSFAEVSSKLTVNFVFDSELAADILPEFRRNFLLDKLSSLKNIGWEWHSENFAMPLKKCLELLAHEEIPDTEKILACKSVLEKYFCENFEEDKNNVWRQSLIENLNRQRKEKFENGRSLSLREANIRHYTLINFHRNLCNSAIHLAHEMAGIIHENDTELENRNPAFPNWPEPDFSLPEIEIDGVVGYWIEETDALIFKEKFRSALQICYEDLRTYHARRVQKLLDCLNEHTSDFYLNEWAERFRNNCNVQENVTSLDVMDKKCTVTNYVPAYWEGQEARQITRTYIEVVKYEEEYKTNFISAVQDKLIRNFMSSVCTFSEWWQKDLSEYWEIINSLESAEEFSQRMEELQKITERLTSIDCKLDEEK